MKILVGATLCILGAITSGCTIRSEPVVVRPAPRVVVQPAPVVVVQPAPVVVYEPVPVYKYKHKRRHGDENDQGENEQ